MPVSAQDALEPEFLKPFTVRSPGIDSQPGGIDSLESIHDENPGFNVLEGAHFFTR